MTQITKIGIFLISVCYFNFGHGQTINNNFFGKRNIEFPVTSSIYEPVRVSHSTGDYMFILTTPLVKLNGQFVIDTPTKRPLLRIKQMELDSLVIPDSTFFVAFGIFTILSKEMEKREALPMVSFEISNMPKIGDSALFQFSLVTDRIDGVQFSPEVYFSKSIEFKDDLLQGLRKMKSSGKLTLIKKANDLYYGYYNTIVTKELAENRWIHLIASYTGDLSHPFTRGLIAPFSLIELNEKTEQINSENTFIRFDLLSSTLSAANNERLEIMIKSAEKTTKIQIISELAKVGNKESVVFYAYLRMEAVRKKLIESGIIEQNIEIISPQFKDLINEESNREVKVMFF